MQLPDPTIGLLIISARHAIRQAICVRARKHRLTTQQFWAVYSLRQLPGLSPGELGQWMQLDAPAASRLVAELTRRKIIEVRPDREDRRRTRLFLTDKGAPLAEKLQVIAAQYLEATTQGMSDAEVAALRSGLEKVVSNLAGFVADPEHAPRPKPADAA